MKAVSFERFGTPADVLQIGDIPKPTPGPGEVLVRMIASPINPSDLLFAKGRYGIIPDLPARSGFEGVGVVEAAGPGLIGLLRKGKRVCVMNQAGGNWAEYVVVPAVRVIPVPKDIPDEQAACFFVNPATVLGMVRHVLKVPKGAWLLQTAGGSSLGRMINKLGRHDGFRVINVVRRIETADELKRIGAEAVISPDAGPIEEQVRAITGGAGVPYALDCVGGDMGTGAFKSLAASGRMLVYGTMSHEPIRIDPREMISGKKVLEGFYLGHWLPGRGIPRALLLFREIAAMIRAGVLETEIGDRLPLDRVNEAARLAEEPGRAGKVLLTIG